MTFNIAPTFIQYLEDLEITKFSILFTRVEHPIFQNLLIAEAVKLKIMMAHFLLFVEIPSAHKRTSTLSLYVMLLH